MVMVRIRACHEEGGGLVLDVAWCGVVCVARVSIH